MQKYAIAALDMDGTLLNSHHDTTPYTREVLSRIAEAGCRPVLATGRAMSELTALLAPMPSVRYVICECGACIYDVFEKKSIHRTPFPHETVDFLIDVSRRCDVIVQFFMDDQSYICAPFEVDLTPYKMNFFRPVFEAGSIFDENLLEKYQQCRRPVDKVLYYFKSEEERAEIVKILEGHDLALAGSNGIGLEISPKDATKADGLRKLCEHLNITPADCIAIGDSDNDLDILRIAGLPIAMGNAKDSVKAICREVTDDNDHDGAAKALEKFLL